MKTIYGLAIGYRELGLEGMKRIEVTLELRGPEGEIGTCTPPRPVVGALGPAGVIGILVGTPSTSSCTVLRGRAACGPPRTHRVIAPGARVSIVRSVGMTWPTAAGAWAAVIRLARLLRPLVMGLRIEPASEPSPPVAPPRSVPKATVFAAPPQE